MDREQAPEKHLTSSSGDGPREDLSTTISIRQVYSLIRRDVRAWGIGLILTGLTSIVFAGFLDPIWGKLLVLIGALSVIAPLRGMFIVFGIGFLVAGVANIFSGSLDGWTFFGLLQIYWAYQQFRKYLVLSAILADLHSDASTEERK